MVFIRSLTLLKSTVVEHSSIFGQAAGMELVFIKKKLGKMGGFFPNAFSMEKKKKAFHDATPPFLLPFWPLPN